MIKEDVLDTQEEDDEKGDPQKEGNKEELGWRAPLEEEEQKLAEKQATNGQATGDGAAIGNATSGIWTGEDLPMNYHQRVVVALNKFTGLVGTVVTRDD